MSPLQIKTPVSVFCLPVPKNRKSSFGASNAQIHQKWQFFEIMWLPWKLFGWLETGKGFSLTGCVVRPYLVHRRVSFFSVKQYVMDFFLSSRNENSEFQKNTKSPKTTQRKPNNNTPPPPLSPYQFLLIQWTLKAKSTKIEIEISTVVNAIFCAKRLTP